MRPSDSDAARRLLELAETASRLPAYDRRNPHAFHEAKSELAAELRKLARSMAPGRRSSGREQPLQRRVVAFR